MYRTLVAALALGGVAHAQQAPDTLNPAPAAAGGEAPADGRVVYDPSFFAQFAPQTALDMVSRVPGFKVDSGADRRGFSGSAGNVLIDGARPSAKSQSLQDILGRIPATQVAHVELIRAASSGEATGQSVLVNVVRTVTTSGGSGTYDVDLQRTEDNRVEARGSGSYTGHILGGEFTLGANRYIEQRPVVGDRVIRNGLNVLTGSRQDFTPRTFRTTTTNASFTAPLWGGTLNLNGSTERWNFRTNLESFGYSPAETLTDSFRLSINERRRSRELGGDYEHKFGDWTLKAIGLDTRRWYANDERTLSRDASFNTTDILAQRRRNLSNESIGRLTAAWAINDKHRLEFGGETAFNSLVTDLTLTDNGAAIPLQGADVTVEEERQEGFATWTWKPTSKWSLESNVTFETSTISQSGDASASRTLSYWKPSFQASRQVGARDQVRAKISRDVSQLDFGDFASSATLADNTVAAGNPNLRPQSTWRLEGVIDKRFGENGALTLTVAHEWAEDATDLIPVLDLSSVPPGCVPTGCLSGPVYFDAPGNIGKGENTNIQLKGTVPLGAIIPGGQIEFNVNYVDSEVTDPTTHLLRPVSSNADIYSEVHFRQDLPTWKLAWGLNFEKASERRFFRVSERETFEEGPFVDAFVETTRIKGMKVRLLAENLLDPEFRRQRRFFTPNRAGAFNREEIRERQMGRFLGIEVSGNF